VKCVVLRVQLRALLLLAAAAVVVAAVVVESNAGISRIASPRQALSRLQHQSKHSQETLPMCNEWPEVDV
jgi:hypothetical protein